jgi:hypothetical protein
MSTVPVPASPQYDFSGYSNSHEFGQNTQWNGGTGLDVFNDYSNYEAFGSKTFSSMDIPAAGPGGLSSSMTSNPAGTGTSFAAPGLPFQGLDFIKNFNTSGSSNGNNGNVPGGYYTSEQQTLWQSYDPGAFDFGPDMPFSLDLDNSNHNHEGQR